MRKALFLLLLFLSALAVSAAPEVSTGRYTLSLPEAWKVNPDQPPSDSFTVLQREVIGATLLLISDDAEGAPSDPDSLLDGTDLVPGKYVPVERKTLNLGGREFAMVEYRDTAATGLQANFRYRAYAATGNGVFFMAILAYMQGIPGPSAIGELEAALAGLVLKGGSAVRPLVRGLPALLLRPADARDALGRQSAAGAPARPARAVLFARERDAR